MKREKNNSITNQNSIGEKKIYSKSDRAITLIALVVTIVVLLILAGISITMLTNNGILDKSKLAVNEHKKAAAKEEMSLLISEYQTDYYLQNNNSNSLANYIASQIGSGKISQNGTITVSGNLMIYTFDNGDTVTISINGDNIVESTPQPVGKETTTTNRALSGKTENEAKYSYKNPIIPQGFKAIDTETAKWIYTDDTETTVSGWNNGLVIEDIQNHNQFVWVPCMITGDNLEIAQYKNLFSEWDENNISNHDGSITEIHTYNEAYPDTITDETSQISNYQGFYVARYESSYENGTNTDSNNIDTISPTSKSGAKVWNFIEYDKAVRVAKKMINNTSIYGNTKSGLITGTQWDTIMQWYGLGTPGFPTYSSNQNWGTCSDLDYSVNGQYFTYLYSYPNKTISSWLTGSTTHIANDSTKVYHASGLNSNGIKKNIADLGGNLSEITAEYCTDEQVNGQYLILRGGNATYPANGDPVIWRSYYNYSYVQYWIGFRCVLYIE